MQIHRLLATIAFALTAPLLLAQAKPTASATTPASASAAKSSTTAATKPVTATKPASGQPLDLNTATPDQLKALPGIGDAYAKRIIDGRPYTMKNQIVQRGIVPQATYDKVKDSIVAHRPVAAKK